MGQVFTIGLDIAKSVFQVDGGGYAEIFSSMDAAFAASNRIPNVVLSGHVHSYLKFFRALGEVSLPYIIAGGGGFNSSQSLHKQADGTGHRPASFPDGAARGCARKL